MSKVVRLIVKENETPPALYQRIFDGRQNKRTSSDIRALALLAVNHKLDVEPLNEQYVGDTQLTIEFSLGSSVALTSRLEQVMRETGVSQAKALLKLATAGWFHKTNPKPPSLSAATPPVAAGAASPVAAPAGTANAANTNRSIELKPDVAKPVIELAPIDPASLAMSNKMMDSVMDAWGE